MPTTEDTIETSKLPLNKGHKRSQSNTMDYSHSSAVTATAVHRRSRSFDINLLAYEKIDKLSANNVDRDFSSVAGKGDEQDEENLQQEEQQQSQLTASHLCQDEVDFSFMFGKWKGM